VEEFVVVVVIEGERLPAVGTSHDEDAITAHLAELGDIAEQPFRAEMTANSFNGRGSRECHREVPSTQTGHATVYGVRDADATGG